MAKIICLAAIAILATACGSSANGATGGGAGAPAQLSGCVTGSGGCDEPNCSFDSAPDLADCDSAHSHALRCADAEANPDYAIFVAPLDPSVAYGTLWCGSPGN